MPVPFRIGVLQLSMEPLQQIVRMAQACDRAGFDIFWLAEAYPWWRKHGMEARSSTAMTAVIATQTKNIVIGWAIISPYTRHPVQIAMGKHASCRIPPETADSCSDSALPKSS